ncbi:MAG: hypothetical protein Q8S84_01190 [bacterium]|nr:hypothetical protein [bacterium]MDP3380188.1 hypothetical protein [bacterium]
MYPLGQRDNLKATRRGRDYFYIIQYFIKISRFYYTSIFYLFKAIISILTLLLFI